MWLSRMATFCVKYEDKIGVFLVLHCLATIDTCFCVDFLPLLQRVLKLLVRSMARSTKSIRIDIRRN